MARIRTIKPDFWTDPVMVGLPPLARLLYIGTWNFAICDQGHLEDDPFRLKLQILPAENCDVDYLIDMLVEAGRLVRLEVDGKPYLHVKRLADHQKVDGRWAPRCPVCKAQTPPKLPQTPASSGETHRASPKLTEPHPSKGKEGKGKEGNPSAPAAPSRATDDRFAEFWSQYPKKKDKGHAVKAWKVALKKADAQTIIDGLQAQLPMLNGSDPQFIPYGATWLNGERWSDEITKPRPTGSAGWWDR